VKAVVDTELCMGHGQCYARAPEVYAPDEDGFCVIQTPTIEPAWYEQAATGAEACPESAITLTDDQRKANDVSATG
jgi:ferredoxin